MPQQDPNIRRGETHGWTLYVIRLKANVRTDRRFRERNPDLKLRRPCVYVGMTYLSAEERFEQHKTGIHSARIARRFGKHVMLSECRVTGPMSRQRAQKKEAALADGLGNRGFGVWCN
jgi:hypothetical protein